MNVNQKNKRDNKMNNQKTYKLNIINIISSLRIVSMIPGDRKVARCFNFFKNYGEIF